MAKLRKLNLTAKEIVKLLAEHRSEINGFGVKKIGLFGSYLRNEQNRKSDIDLLVVFERVTFDNFIGLKFFLEDLFGKKVDLVIERSLKPAFNYVKKEAVYA